MSELGGDELGQFGDQLATFTGKLKEFNAANVKGAKGLGGIKVALVAAAAVGGFKFGQWLVGATKLNEDFNESLKESEKIVAQAVASRANLRSQNQFELSLVKNPDAQRAQLEKLIESAKTNMKGAGSAARAANKDFEEWNTTFRSWTGNKILALNKKLAEDAAKKTAEYKKEWTDLRVQLTRFNQSESVRLAEERAAVENQRRASVKEFIADLREQANTIALTNEQLEIYKLRQLGATEAQIRAAKAEQFVRAARKPRDEEKSTTPVDKGKSLIDGLRQQLVALRDGADAAAELKDRMNGVGIQARRQASELRGQINAIKERNKLEAEAKKLIEGQRSAGQKFAVEFKKLMRLKGAELINPRQFAKAATELKKQLKLDIKSKGGQAAGGPGQLQAREDRFLTRGRGTDKFAQQLDVSKKANQIMSRVFEAIGDSNGYLSRLLDKEPAAEKVVG